MIETLGIVTVLFFIVGVEAYKKKLIVCFYLWAMSNLITAGIHLDAGLYSLLFRDLVFLVVCIDIIWKNKKEESAVKL